MLIGSSADVQTGRSLESALESKVAVLNLIGRTNLPALAAVLSMARALVSNDSGALHLGAALGLPVTAIFGPTDERRTGPRGVSIEDFILSVFGSGRSDADNAGLVPSLYAP